MNIHEFQAKLILQKYGIPVPEFHVASSLKDVEELLQRTGWTAAVVKVQVHAGGRGKAGGVKIAKDRQAILQAARDLLGKKIVNEQTGAEGMVAYQVLLSPLISIAHEYYLGMTLSRERGQNVLIASPIGGVDIEEVARQHPEQVLILPLPDEGLFRSYHLLRVAKFMGWTGETAKQGMALTAALVKAFSETDATLLEINPLIKTETGNLSALDAKLVVDDNALYRQPELRFFFDPTQVNPQEARAQLFELAYVALDGDIGCMVNGAGLAMSTMDLIHHFGGQPANFLDVGGSATAEKVAEGFTIILSDPKVKAILVNIFGGIMNCETIAEGIIRAAKETHIHVPLIVRLEGTNVEKGRQLVEESGLNSVVSNDLTEAAKEVVKRAKRTGVK